MQGSCESRSSQPVLPGEVSQDVASVATAEPGTALVTEICDEDYRCIWRPCEALEEVEGGGPAG